MKMRAAVSPLINELKTRVVYFAVVIAVVMGVIVNAPAASAQQNASQAMIPFAFSANHQVFPAGVYTLLMKSNDSVTLVSYETGVRVEVAGRASRGFNIAAKNNLLFLRDDRGYHLLSVRFAHGNLQSELKVQPRTEREIAKATPAMTTEVAMN